jgi:hypothetical protein
MTFTPRTQSIPCYLHAARRRRYRYPHMTTMHGPHPSAAVLGAAPGRTQLAVTRGHLQAERFIMAAIAWQDEACLGIAYYRTIKLPFHRAAMPACSLLP